MLRIAAYLHIPLDYVDVSERTLLPGLLSSLMQVQQSVESFEKNYLKGMVERLCLFKVEKKQRVSVISFLEEEPRLMSGVTVPIWHTAPAWPA